MDDQRHQIKSRETLFHFYQKDPNKTKRLNTPGYIGLESFQNFYKKYFTSISFSSQNFIAFSLTVFL